MTAPIYIKRAGQFILASGWHTEETFRSLATLAQGAVRVALLLNGGSIVAILTFVGSNADSAIWESLIHAVWPSIPAYLIGTVAAAFAALFAYVTNLRLYGESTSDSKKGAHRPWLWAGIGCVFFALVTFLVGSGIAWWRLWCAVQ